MSKAQALTSQHGGKVVGIWYFWESYQQALDKLPIREVQRTVDDVPPQLNRETLPTIYDYSEQISRFLYCVQQMPRAWGSRPWSSYELIKAGNNVANDLFRRKMKRELGPRSRVDGLHGALEIR